MTTSSTNFTGLYSGGTTTPVPNSAYGNANVVSLLATSTDGANTVGNISATGNVRGGNLSTPGVVSATGNITTAGFFVGNFAGNISGNLTVPGSNTQVIYNNSGNAGASAGFTFDQSSNVATVSGNIVGGNITTAGNVTGNYILGNGSQLTGIAASYGNANVATFLAAFGSNTISTTGNVTAGYFLGDGSQLTGLPANYGNSNVTTLLAAFGSNTISTTGTVTAGDVTGANLATTNGYVNATTGDLRLYPAAGSNVVIQAGVGGANLSVQGNITGANILTGGAVSATGNVTGNYILGNGSQLTGLPANYGNSNVTTLLASFGSNTISTTGNITGGLFTGNGAGLTNINASNIVGAYGNANVANFLGSYGSNTLSTTGNVTTGNLNVQLDAVITGNLTVNGNTTLVNSNVVTINDKFINVANNAATAAAANGGGLGVGPVGGEYATLTYNSTNNDWNTNIPLSVNGNVTGGNFVGNGQYLSSIAGANITGTVANATFATSAGTASTAGSANTAVTVTGNAQANITSLGTLTSLSVSGNTTTGNLLTGGVVSATGNISGNYFIGNGSLLTGISGNGGGSYGDSNVVTLLAAFGSNSISTTGNISAGNAALTGNLNFGAVVVRNNNNRLFSDSTEFNTLQVNTTASVTGNITGGNILTGGIVSAAGTVTGGNITTGGAVSATGNIQGNVFIGNGAGLTNVSTYGNANVATFLAAFGSNTITTTGNITSGNLALGTGNLSFGSVILRNYNNRFYTDDAQFNALTVDTTISATGNITGNYILGNGSQLSGIAATYGNANVSNFLANGFGSNTIVTTGNISANNFTAGNVVTLGGTVTIQNFNNRFYLGETEVASNFTVTGGANTVSIIGATGNITTPGLISATGNITGGNIVTAGIVSVAGNVLASNASLTGNLNFGTVVVRNNSNRLFTEDAEFTNVDIGATLDVTGTVSATGNITGGNITTLLGTLTGGNIAISNNLILNTVTANANTTPTPNRILMGNGYNGDYSATYDPLRITSGGVLQIINRVAVANTQTNTTVRQFTSTQFADLSNQTYSSANYRISGGSLTNFVGNGTYTATGAQWASISGGAGLVSVGNVGNIAMGNATVSHAVGQVGTVIVGTGGNIGNAVATASGVNILSVTGNVTSGIAYATQLVATANLVTPPTTAIGFYHPGNTNVYGQGTGNGWRSATNYYAFRNDDSAAQIQLGSLRAYHEFQATGNTTGTWNIDKSAGQIQAVSATGNITIGSYTNFVTTANDGTNNDNQIDTVTLIIEQGATPYTVTMPTGNAAIRYASGNSTVPATANSTTTISIQAYRSAANATVYITTISPAAT